MTKPSDKRGLGLMNKCAEVVMRDSLMGRVMSSALYSRERPPSSAAGQGGQGAVWVADLIQHL